MIPTTGFQGPNFTIVPNDFFDLAKDMSEAEIRVVITMMRETFGWQRTQTKLSLTRLCELTGMSRQGVMNGLDKAKGRGLVRPVEETRDGTVWEVIVEQIDKYSDTSLLSRLVNQVDQTSQPSRPLLVNEVDPSKEREIKDQEGKSKDEQDQHRKNDRGHKPNRAGSNGSNAQDHSDGADAFPSDVRAIVAMFCELWGFDAPDIRDKSTFKLWWNGAREILIRCGKYDPVRVLLAYRQEFVRKTEQNRGKPPFDVFGPQSLVNVLAGYVLSHGKELSVQPDDRSDDRYDENGVLIL